MITVKERYNYCEILFCEIRFKFLVRSEGQSWSGLKLQVQAFPIVYLHVTLPYNFTRKPVQ